MSSSKFSKKFSLLIAVFFLSRGGSICQVIFMKVLICLMQAYTVELEAEVSQLKEENMKLRKQQAVLKKTVCPWLILRKSFVPWRFHRSLDVL
jgi:hypothetical protein